MNKAEDAVIKYQISFEKYKNGRADEVVALLDRANAEMAAHVKKTTGVYTKARYKEIAKKLKDVSRALREDVDETTDIDGIIDWELRKQSKILEKARDLVKEVGGVGKVDFLYPSREQIKTAALFRPVVTGGWGMTYQGYLDGIESGLFGAWDNAVRTGYLTGRTTRQIVRDVLGGVNPTTKLAEPGAMAALRNSVYSNTRTVLQSFANETRNRVYEANEKYFGGKGGYKYEYLATLDSRTCLPAGEKVLTPDGYKSIERIKKGDFVIGGSGQKRLVLGCFSKRAEELVEIGLENGKTIRCTPDHLVLTGRGWIEAGELKEGDDIKEKL